MHRAKGFPPLVVVSLGIHEVAGKTSSVVSLNHNEAYPSKEKYDLKRENCLFNRIIPVGFVVRSYSPRVRSYSPA